MTEWHNRYRGPGVMIYWHVERKSVCIYSQLGHLGDSHAGRRRRRCSCSPAWAGSGPSAANTMTSVQAPGSLSHLGRPAPFRSDGPLGRCLSDRCV